MVLCVVDVVDDGVDCVLCWVCFVWHGSVWLSLGVVWGFSVVCG